MASDDSARPKLGEGVAAQAEVLGVDMRVVVPRRAAVFVDKILKGA